MRRLSLLAVATMLWPGCVCSKTAPAEGDGSINAGDPRSASKESTGWAAPIAAANLGDGSIVVAGVDLAAKTIRLRKIGEHDDVLGERSILDNVSASPEADLKVVPAAGGAAVTWHGTREGKVVRQLVVTRPDLAPIGSPVDVAASSCATRDALFFTDGKKVFARRWSGSEPLVFDLPKDKEAGLVCAAHRAFAVVEEDDASSLLPLPLAASDAGAAGPSPMSLLRDRDFGDDEQRERAEYTVEDEFGVVRLGNAGTFAIRELRGGALQPIRRLKTTIPHDDDVVAVDASTDVLVIVFTHEAEGACTDSASATKVRALRVDRKTWEESIVDLAPGQCGREVGPFFTAAKGEGVVIAWAEHTSAVGKARAPITGLSHAHVTSANAPAVARMEEAAEALVDAGCDKTRCYAAALVRDLGGGPAKVKVLRY